ncbi:MAG: NgoBV family restriction endonuclease [Kiritimatiellae bacterium]|nr:NgoBV family restriction endonuclease [Kiritimatiellia bacterium]
MNGFRQTFNDLKAALPQIAFNIGDVAMVIKRNKSLGGKVVAVRMRNWLEVWLNKHGISYALSDSTQRRKQMRADKELTFAVFVTHILAAAWSVSPAKA